MAREYRLSLPRRLANMAIRPMIRLGLADRHTYLLTVPGRRTALLDARDARRARGRALARRPLRRDELGQERARRRPGRALPRRPQRDARDRRAGALGA